MNTLQFKTSRSRFAEVHEDAFLHPSVSVAAFATIAEDVIIEEGSYIGPNVVIMAGTKIGKNCHIHTGAVIGAEPQDLKYLGERTEVEIGDGTSIREFVTVSRGTVSKGVTKIGKNVLIMAYAHIGHDCVIGDHVVVANAAQIAGEVRIDIHARISAGVLMHQFTRAGMHVMVQGGTKVTKDIPPFALVGREPLSFAGINVVGLRQHGFTNTEIESIHNCYRYLYKSTLNTSQAIETIENEVVSSEVRDDTTEFCQAIYTRHRKKVAWLNS
jgi:UDP-N-acetylglucosamine acyltransferase